MFCIVSYSTIEKLKLLHDYQKSDYGLKVYSDYHGVRPANMSKWIKQFLLAGLAGLIRPKHNQKYSLETKLTAVKAYLSGKYTNQAISSSIKLEIFLNYINGLSVTIMTNSELIRQRESESEKWDEK